MKLTVRKSFPDDPDSDLYIIERADHDGREWWESVRFGRQFCKTSRICGQGGVTADIEGSLREMIAVAAAIRSRCEECFKRCFVDARQEPVILGSPRNDNGEHAHVTYVEADDLAIQIERLAKTNGA